MANRVAKIACQEKWTSSQLLWGPLSDRYGRKPVLLIGLTIFALGSLGMLWVENAATLLILRLPPAIVLNRMS